MYILYSIGFFYIYAVKHTAYVPKWVHYFWSVLENSSVFQVPYYIILVFGNFFRNIIIGIRKHRGINVIPPMLSFESRQVGVY